MKTLKLLILLACLVTGIVRAQEYNNKHKFYIDIGLTSGTYKNSFTGGGYGAIGFYFKTKGRQSAIDIKSKEQYIVSPEAHLGALSLTYRLYFSRGFYFGVGGAHNHGIHFHHFTEDPLGSVFATNQHIMHRTGVIGEVGYDFKSFIRGAWLGMYPVTNLSFTYMPGYGDPVPMVNFSLGFKFGMKKAVQ